MRLDKILDKINSFEKNSLLKILDGIIATRPAKGKEISNILAANQSDLKAFDSQNIARVFNLVNAELFNYILQEFKNSNSQLDVLIDILIREGNSIVKLDWFARLYEKEIASLHKKIKEFNASLLDEKSEISPSRKRDYVIYRSCLEKAYTNDEENNLSRKITSDEQTILNTLSEALELSQEEIKLITYSILPLQKRDIESVVNDLKNSGVIFFAKKTNTIYVSDEMVRLLRTLRGKQIADKSARRILKSFREPQINIICRKHNVDWKSADMDTKVNRIVQEGISIIGILKEDIYKDSISLTEKKKVLSDLAETVLKIGALKGSTLDDKIASLVDYFVQHEMDDKIGISHDGYASLLESLKSFDRKIEILVRTHFDFQEEHPLNADFLGDYNIKPRDILELVPDDMLVKFCEANGIKTKGDTIANILSTFTDSKNLYLENYHHIAYRNLNELKANNILFKEADLGLKFEELTKTILSELGFTVDDELRNKINTKNDKIDILLNQGNGEVIVVECKTNKDSSYNKFSAVSRQLKAYCKLAGHNNCKVIKSLLIAPEFSDDFVRECGLDYELNLSLVKASTLFAIHQSFKTSKLKSFPHNLFMRDVVIDEARVLKAIAR